MRRTAVAATALLSFLVAGCAAHTEHPPRSAPSRTPQPEQLQSSKAYAMLPLGEAPRIPYVYGDHTLAEPHEAPRALLARLTDVTAVAPDRGGWLVASRTGGDGRETGMSSQGFAPVTRLDHALRPVWTRYGADRFAVGDRSSLAYFTVPDRPESPGRLTLLGSDGTVRRAWTIPFEQVAVPIGVPSGGSVVYNLTTATGIPLGIWTTGSAARATPHRLPLYLAEAARRDLVAGRLRDGCQLVIQGRAELWRRCVGFKLAAFSPDGRYVATWHTETGGEFESAYVLDARTGQRVTDTTVGSPTSFHGMPSGAIAWEDNAHVLISFDDGTSDDWEVLRLGLDGRLERATDALHEPHTESAFVFASLP
jgi:hypothetical protein